MKYTHFRSKVLSNGEYKDSYSLAEKRAATCISPLMAPQRRSCYIWSYVHRYLTGDGTSVQEQGALKVNPDGEYKGDYTLVKKGSYQYTAPDGTPVQVTYTADENGFQPQGSVIPVAPAATF